MVIMISCLALVILISFILSRRGVIGIQKGKKIEYPINTEDSGKAIVLATKYYHILFGEKLKIERVDISRASLKYFWQQQAELAPFRCSKREDEMKKLAASSSETDSLLYIIPVDIKKFDSFTHKYEMYSLGLLGIMVDREFRMLDVDCDSGLIYRKF